MAAGGASSNSNGSGGGFSVQRDCRQNRAPEGAKDNSGALGSRRRRGRRTVILVASKGRHRSGGTGRNRHGETREIVQQGRNRESVKGEGEAWEGVCVEQRKGDDAGEFKGNC